MSDASEKVVLMNDITINDVKYTAGTQDVPKEVAEDLRRIDNTYNKHVMDRNRNNGFIQSAGTLSAGGGAE